jgi:hypothetical protein
MQSPRNIAKIARLAIWATRIFIVAQIVWLPFPLYLIFLDPGFDPFAPENMSTLDMVIAIALSTAALVVPLAYITNAIWLVRAARNAAEFDPKPPSYSGGWTVGWLFIPIANFWMPFRAIRYLWNVSLKGASHATDKTPRFFMIWWGAWVSAQFLAISVTGIATYMSRFGMLSFEEADMISNSTDFIVTLLYIPAAYFCLRIIRTVTDAQVYGDRGRLENVFE